MLQVPKRGAQGDVLQIKDKQVLLQCNKKGHLARDRKSKKRQFNGTSRGPEIQASSASEILTGLDRKEDSSYRWTALQWVHAKGQSFLQGPRRGIQHRCGKYQRESNPSGR